MIVSDGDRVLQIISNLLSNAFRWTPDGGRVELGSGADERPVSVSVDDTGPGSRPRSKSGSSGRSGRATTRGTGPRPRDRERARAGAGWAHRARVRPAQGSRFELVLAGLVTSPSRRTVVTASPAPRSRCARRSSRCGRGSGRRTCSSSQGSSSRRSSATQPLGARRSLLRRVLRRVERGYLVNDVRDAPHDRLHPDQARCGRSHAASSHPGSRALLAPAGSSASLPIAVPLGSRLDPVPLRVLRAAGSRTRSR